MTLDGGEGIVFVDPTKIKIRVDDQDVPVKFELVENHRTNKTDNKEAAQSIGGMVPFVVGTTYRYYLPSGSIPKKITFAIASLTVKGRDLHLPDIDFELGKGMRYRAYPIND